MEADPADVIRSPGSRPDRAVHDPSAEIAASPARYVTELFQAHHLELVRLAVVMVGDLATAEDVVQDAFEQLHRRWRTLRKQSSALDYARSAVLNGSRSVLRRRSVARRHESHITGSRPPDPDAAVALEQRTVLIDAFRVLPRRQREVLALRYYVDMSVADVAVTLRISEGTVRSTASRGLEALAHILSSRAPKEP
jgi:RNA polymerase sigma-70 factor (sigma-E family)